MSLLKSFGIRQEDLIPVKMRKRAANENNIGIIGVVILRLTGTSPSGRKYEAREMVYVTIDTDKLFLSRKACQNLEMISSSFLAISDLDSTEDNTVVLSNDSSVSESAITKPCDCHRCQTPPPKPTSLPFPATEENREHLRQWHLCI